MRKRRKETRRAWGKTRNLIVAAIGRRDQGRNHDCWPILSYGWKDADLDPGGCTGIKNIECTEDGVLVQYGGHKTLCDPTYESEWDLSPEDRETYSDLAFEIVAGCAFPGYWSGDDWSLSIEAEFVVPYVYDQKPGTDLFDIEQTAEQIVDLTERSLRSFQDAMTDCDAALERLYQELRMKYEGEETTNG